MSAPGSAAGSPHYDRDFLLSPTKRNEMMELWEVEKFGTDSFGDPDYVSIYGMRPAEWYARGGTTCSHNPGGGTRSVGRGDRRGCRALGHLCAEECRLRRTRPICRLLQWPLLGPSSCSPMPKLVASNGIPNGFQADLGQFVAARFSNRVDPRRLPRADRQEPLQHHLVAFLGPPWADGLDPVHGLDLSRTRPPINPGL